MPDPAVPEPPTDPANERLRQLMVRCIDAFGAGGDAAVAAVLADHPDDGPTIRDRLQKLARAGLLTSEAPREIPERLGEYRLLQRLGSGGMGVVYLAEQESLRRTVALKLVRPEQMFFPGARERFRREVEAVARLGDPGIVPIYAVGEESGIPFFTMEHVRGATLAAAIEHAHRLGRRERTGRELLVAAAAGAGVDVPAVLPELFAGTWPRAAARIVARMARAVHHAHQQGIVHRDLKPGNAMITPDGRVQLLDFGLAATEGTERITRTGAWLGTLHYMAPEQLLAPRSDARTDVYALGVTLYELLALRPPFHDDSAERLRQRILHGDASPLPSIDPDVPRDLATVCTCAMDREPARRYATAEALALDLEWFLAHRPIMARPAGPLLRTVRWMQRHPAKTTAAVLVLAAAIALPIAVAAGRDGAAEEVGRARADAAANLRGAVGAIARLLAQARSSTLANTPGLDAVRQQQADEAVAMLQSLRASNDDSEAVVDLLVDGLLQAAELRQLAGRHADVHAALADAEQLLARGGPASGPGAIAATVRRATLHLLRGTSLVADNEFAAARASWSRAVELLTADAAAAATPRGTSLLANCHGNLAKLDLGEQRFDAAEAELRAAVALDERLLATAPGAAAELEAVRTRSKLVTLLVQAGHVEQAQAEAEAMVARLRRLRAVEPKAPEPRRELARGLFLLGEILDQRRAPEAGPAHSEAAALATELVGEFPDRVKYTLECNQIGSGVALRLARTGQRSEAIGLLREVRTRSERLVQRPDAPLDERCDLAMTESHLAAILQRHPTKGSEWNPAPTEDAAEAEEAHELHVAAQARMQAVLDARPDDPFFRVALGGLLHNSGMYHRLRDDAERSRADYRSAVQAYERALAAGYAPASEPKRLPLLLQMLAEAEAVCDDPDAAVQALTRLQAVLPLTRAELLEFGKALHLEERPDFAALVAAAQERR